MQKLYKYGFIGLSLAVLAFMGLVQVWDAPMTPQVKMKVAEAASLGQELDELRIESDLQTRRMTAAVEKSQGLNGQAAIDFLPVLRAHMEKGEDLKIRMEAATDRAERLRLELEELGVGGAGGAALPTSSRTMSRSKQTEHPAHITSPWLPHYLLA